MKVCGSCNHALATDFEFCPQCGHFVGDHCGGCKRRMDAEWVFCASCGTEARKSSAEAAKGGKRSAPRETPSKLMKRAS